MNAPELFPLIADLSGTVDTWLKHDIFRGYLLGIENLFGYNVREMVLNGWKIIGFGGMFLFTSRWFVQMWASKQRKQVTMPRSFWYLSIAGSLMLLIYFFGYQKDSVGTLSNLFPLSVAFYNLWLDLTRGRERRQRPGKPESGSSEVNQAS